MRRLICALALSWIAIAPASAQDQSAARAIIAAAGADGVFEPVGAENVVAVRHARSGLVCRLDPAFTNRIVLYPQAARGEDVSCDSHGAGNVFVTLYATRFGFETTLDEQLAGAADAIRQRYPDARPLPATGDVSEAGVPAQSTHFLVTRNGVQMYTRASVAQIGQWVIKLRYSAPAPDGAAAAAAEQTATALWRATLQEMVAEHS